MGLHFLEAFLTLFDSVEIETGNVGTEREVLHAAKVPG